MRVARRQILHLGVGAVDVLRVARKRCPAERPDAAAEQRPDIGRHEAGEGEGVLETFLLRHLADVVAVIERRHAVVPESDHRLDMLAHRGSRGLLHRFRVALALRPPLGQRPALRQVAVDRVVRRGLVGQDVGLDAAAMKLRHDLGRVAQQADRFRLAGLRPAPDHGESLVEARRLLVEIAGAQAEIDAGLVAFDGEARGAGHHRSQRLRPAHAAEPRRQDPFSLEVAAIVLAPGLHEGLVGALHDALRADIDPRAGRHLAVHHQALAIERVEMVPVRPVRHEVGVGDQDARRVRMRPEHADRLAGLHKQRLVVGKRLQRPHDAVEIFPRAGGAADAAIDDQLVRVLGHIGIEIVHQHAQRCFRQPAPGADLGAARRADFADVVARVRRHALPPVGSVFAASSSRSSIVPRCARRRAAFASS